MERKNEISFRENPHPKIQARKISYFVRSYVNPYIRKMNILLTQNLFFRFPTWCLVSVMGRDYLKFALYRTRLKKKHFLS